MSIKPRIFLSYSYNDKQAADNISRQLFTEGFNVASQFKAIKAGAVFFDEIKYVYETSEIIIVLLSENFTKNEKYLFKEATMFLEEARQRNVIVLPILIQKCKIPNEFLEYEILDFTKGSTEGLKKLTTILNNISEINFDSFNSKTFENFAFDLLNEFGFQNIQKHWIYKDKEIDFLAEYYTNTPFETPKMESWVVEVKYYKKERFSVHTIRELIGHFNYVAKGGTKLLLITNSLLTSVAKDFLNTIKEKENISIEVLDGIKLRSIVLKNPSLLSKYFSK